MGVPLERLQDFEGLCYTAWVCLWRDCRILRGCVIQCGCALGRLQDFEGLCYTLIQCGCALGRLQDFEGLCYTMWVCIGQIAGYCGAVLCSVGVPWTDCRILRGCVIQCRCALDTMQDFEGLCYTV